ncbi:LuxR C-terminal-related transcriptional regulator [Iamia sp. SCSIO 61187]|uniref:helix-turn-helix transcriptional regulator n=1 Tax=Iamia sp. SCSIO 61187 TaxID=2722752 RepID=UPI001C62B6CA|nr:LuxR C-terminal-related transcriptional regulator [Iamia sp. SCSIO 61187]
MTAHPPQDADKDTDRRSSVPDARDILGQAKGILMERHAIDDTKALDVLEHLSRARDIPVCEAAALLVRSRRQLPSALGRRPSDPAGDDGPGWPGKEAGLTERESQVLVLASEGLTNAEIGAALFLGRETVKTHLSRAYAKLGVRNRAGAVAFLLRPSDDAAEVEPPHQ